MKITKIARQVKRADRYSIYLDGKYSFSLGEGELLKMGLHSGQELTEQELASFRDESDYGKWFDKTLNLLSYRMRSEWELRDYLKRKKAPEEFVEKILNKLSINGYVNDEQFAKRWVENRRLLKPTSRRKLSMELKQKRIPSDIIDKVLADDKDQVSERELLRQLVEKKRARYPDKLKFMQYLARQGYNYDDIKSVLSDQDSM
jgi:regulatory protein